MSDNKLLAAAAKRLQQLRMIECFDAENLDSRPTVKQQECLDDIVSVPTRWMIGGNRCKPSHSLVQMADGSHKSIVDVRVGDEVMCFDTTFQKLRKTKVTATWNNGVAPVYRYWTGQNYTDSTPNHQMVRYIGGKYTKFTKAEIGLGHPIMQIADEVDGVDTLNSRQVELLGYLLGDGCFTRVDKGERYKGLQFTNTNSEILSHVESLLDETYKLRVAGSGNYYITMPTVGSSGKNQYINLIRKFGLNGLAAHQKFIPNEIFTQSIETRRKFIAGLIATDGCVEENRITYFSTSDKLVFGLQKLLSSVGIFSTISRRSRNNPNHRDEYRLSISKTEHLRKFARTIYVPSKSHKLNPTLEARSNGYLPWGCRKISRVEYLGEMQVYDITVAHPDHNYICDGYVTGNSGKSQTGRREVAWLFTDTHPKFQRPKMWGSGPIQMIIMGRTLDQVENSLWRDLKKFFPEGSYREIRQGTALKKAIHLETKNEILFMSHHGSEHAAEKAQSYKCQYVWLDEMPRKKNIIEELQRRIQDVDGRMLATFTPKIVSREVRKMVDGAVAPWSKKYNILMFERPDYSEEKKQQILAEISMLSKKEQATILSGAWMEDDDAVYSVPDELFEDPVGYSPQWRHVESIDPGNRTGFTIWAENPETGIWYCVLAKYLDNMQDQNELIAATQQLTRGLNIVRRICDPAAPYYIQTAYGHRIKPGYVSPDRKTLAGRKLDLIKNFQDSFVKEIRICPHLEDFAAELDDCRWSPTGDTPKIVAGSKYHLIDTAQYFVDMKPPFTGEKIESKPIHRIIRERAERESKQQKQPKARWQIAINRRNTRVLRNRVR